MNKADDERRVFEEFAALAGLRIDPASVRSEEPPLPDISCLIDGRRHYFELTRVADQPLADETGRLLTRARKTGDGGVGRFLSYDDRTILVDAVERKAATRYQTGGDPRSLLVYYDGVIHVLALLELVEPTFRDLQTKYRHHWTALWLYDRVGKRCLGPQPIEGP
jgi:hypothetical protein